MEKADSSPLSRQALYANKKEWNRFLSIFLLAVGIGFTGAEYEPLSVDVNLSNT